MWISGTIDWECSSNLSLMSISSYVVHSTKETGNMYTEFPDSPIKMIWPANDEQPGCKPEFIPLPGRY